MKTVKTTLVMATLIAAVAVSACRREEYKPLKLGAGDVAVPTQVAR